MDKTLSSDHQILSIENDKTNINKLDLILITTSKFSDVNLLKQKKNKRIKIIVAI